MPYSQKYCLVSLLEPIEANVEFGMANWPLHVTLADVFAVDSTTSLEERLAGLLGEQPPVNAVAGSESTLGDTKVVLLDESEQLVELHKRLIDLLESCGASFNNPEFTREGFLPHSTIQKTKRLHSGDIVNVSTVSLVDMFPDNNWQQRRILHTFKLQGK